MRKVVGSMTTLVGVFLGPCVGPIPLVGLTLTWFTEYKTSTSHYAPVVNPIVIIIFTN